MICFGIDNGRNGNKIVKYNSSKKEFQRSYFDSKFINVDFENLKHLPIFNFKKDNGIIATIDAGLPVAYGDVCNKLSPPENIQIITNDELFPVKAVDYALVAIGQDLEKDCDDVKIAINLTKDNMKQGEMMKEKLEGEHTVKFFNTLGKCQKESSFKITICGVFYQGWAAYMNYVIDSKFNIDKRYGIANAVVFDQGRKTLVGAYISLLSPSKPICWDLGTEKFFKYLKDDLAEKYSLKYRTHELERIVTHGKVITDKGGIPIDLNILVNKNALRLGQEIVNNSLEDFGDYNPEESLYTGGGTYLFKDVIKEKFPKMIISEEPIYDNSLGLAKVMARKFIYEKTGD